MVSSAVSSHAGAWAVPLAVLLMWLLVMPPSAGAEPASGQAIGVEAVLLTLHPSHERDASAEHYPRRLDEAGLAVWTPGVEASYERGLADALLGARAWRITLGGLSDSAARGFGYAAVTLRWGTRWHGPWLLDIGVGPGLIWRDSWQAIPGYRNDGRLTESDTFLPGKEHRWLPLGEVDLHYRLTPDADLVWSVVPGLPLVIVNNVGLHWRW